MTGAIPWRRLRHALVSLPLACSSIASAQITNDAKAKSLAQNVVIVVGDSDGFGFVVGEGGGAVYIATARHVVINEAAVGEVRKSVRVTFSIDRGAPRDAEVLSVHESGVDLALLRAIPPSGYRWERAALAPPEEQRRPTRVWFIGRNGDWFIPVTPGAILSEQPSARSQIEVEGLSVARGSSGAPLVSTSGIAGMIIADSANDSRALTIDAIGATIGRWGYPWALTRAVSAGGGPASGPMAQPCSVRVDSNPPGDVTIDGVSRGSTPTTISLADSRTAVLEIQKGGYETFRTSVDCQSGSVNARLSPLKADITLSYAGDPAGCALAPVFRIGGRQVIPTGNSFSVSGVPVGRQSYTVSGTIGCPAGTIYVGYYVISGSGSIDVEDGAEFAVMWNVTGVGQARVQLSRR